MKVLLLLLVVSGCAPSGACRPAPEFGAMSDQPVGGVFGTEVRGDDPKSMDGGPTTKSQNCQSF